MKITTIRSDRIYAILRRICLRVCADRPLSEKNGASIYEATITPTEEILKQSEDFWK